MSLFGEIMSNIEKSSKLLDINNLKIMFKTKKGKIIVVENISFKVEKNKVLGIVGESGSGKSVTALSIIKLLPERISEIVDGSINFKDVDITKLPEKFMQRIRGKEISMVFQDPLTSLNPSLNIKIQLIEGIILDKKMSKKEALEYSINLLRQVGISDPKRRINEYPFKFSGGMQQRVMIAMAISRNPLLLIADECTTAVDVSIQEQILDLLLDLKNKFNMGLIIITHDMGVIAKMCDEVLVMYAGKIMEIADVFELFNNPQHPYTAGLLNTVPKLNLKSRLKLPHIEGSLPEIGNVPDGCRFHPRCDRKIDICKIEKPRLEKINDNHIYYCWNPIKGS